MSNAFYPELNGPALVRLADHARLMAYRVRCEQDPRPDTEELARAWDGLRDAALAIAAIHTHRTG